LPVDGIGDAFDDAGPAIGPALLPQVISLGSRKVVVSLGPDSSAPPGEPSRNLV